MRGKISVSWISGLLVRIVLNGPRISRGASGFGSHVSIWLGAPRLKIIMQARSSFALSTAPIAFSPLSIGSESPSAPSVPAWRKSRRVTPSQVETEPLLEKVNMGRKAGASVVCLLARVKRGGGGQRRTQSRSGCLPREIREIVEH